MSFKIRHSGSGRANGMWWTRDNGWQRIYERDGDGVDRLTGNRRVLVAEYETREEAEAVVRTLTPTIVEGDIP